MKEFPLSSCCNFLLRLFWQESLKAFCTHRCWTVSLLHGEEQLSSIFLCVGRAAVMLSSRKKGCKTTGPYSYPCDQTQKWSLSISGQVPYSHRGYIMSFDIICPLLLQFQYWTEILRPLKLFCTCNCYWISPNIEYPFISVWVHSLLLLSL